MPRKVIDRKQIKLDFGTFKLYRIEILEDQTNKKKILKIFYKLKDKHVKDELTMERYVIYQDTAEDYASLARSYHEKTMMSNAKIFSPTPTGLFASLIE